MAQSLFRSFSRGSTLGCLASCALGVLYGYMQCRLSAADAQQVDKGVRHERIWTATWGSAQLSPYGTEVLPSGTMDGSTLRQVVHLSAGGTRLRLRLSNAYGERPLTLAQVHVALKAQGNNPGVIESGTDRVLTFSGHSDVTVPMGADYFSDALTLTLPAQSDLVVTLEITSAPAQLTFHAGARATSFLLKGRHASEEKMEAPQTFTRWYFLSGVEVNSATSAGSVVALGDSITDGHGASLDANDRWPDVLSARMVKDRVLQSTGVVNEGIGGNRVLADGLGANALARFDRDVLSIAGARVLIVMEGINDLGGLDRMEEHSPEMHHALVADLEKAFVQMMLRAHTHHIRILGATLTPYLGSDYYHPSAASEADRISLNEWIRHSGTFDSVIDFDAALRDPAVPGRLAPTYDSGDHLHPSASGYKRMGEAISLDVLK